MFPQVYGKTLENVRKRVDIRVLRAPEERQAILKRVVQPSFKRFTIFGDSELDLDSEVIDDPSWTIPGVDSDIDSNKSCAVGVHNRKTEVCLSKPIFVGMSVLDLSKMIMFDFYYGHLKALYTDSIQMCYTDTDSVIVHIKTDDVYADMANHLDKYDISNYPTDHPLYSTANKKVIGKFKDELNGMIMTEFIGLRRCILTQVKHATNERKGLTVPYSRTPSPSKSTLAPCPDYAVISTRFTARQQEK